MHLWHDFKTNQGKVIRKWRHYFPIYERHLCSWQNKTVFFVEIGVGRGGSLQMWQRYLGPLSTIVGIDIRKDCRRHQEHGISVRIGDQSDLGFLKSVLDEFGQPDIILDDGSHQMRHIRATFDFLYPRLSKNGVYIVEDLHTAYWEEFGGGMNSPVSFINFCKDLVDSLNADHSRSVRPPDSFTRNTFAISFYDSVVVFERGTIPVKSPEASGSRKA